MITEETLMTTPQQDAADQRGIEKMLAGHRQAPNGRNFLAFTMRYQNDDAYKTKFDSTFPAAKGSEFYMNEAYCSKCGKLKIWCDCERGN